MSVLNAPNGWREYAIGLVNAILVSDEAKVLGILERALCDSKDTSNNQHNSDHIAGSTLLWLINRPRSYSQDQVDSPLPWNLTDSRIQTQADGVNGEVFLKAIPKTAEAQFTTPLHIALYVLLARRLPDPAHDSSPYRILFLLASNPTRESPFSNFHCGVDGAGYSVTARLLNVAVDLSKSLASANSESESIFDKAIVQLATLSFMVSVLVGTQTVPGHAVELFGNASLSMRSPITVLCNRLADRLERFKGVTLHSKLASIVDIVLGLLVSQKPSDAVKEQVPFQVLSLLFPLLGLTLPLISHERKGYEEFFSGIVSLQTNLKSFTHITGDNSELAIASRHLVCFNASISQFFFGSTLNELKESDKADLLIILLFALDSVRLTLLSRKPHQENEGGAECADSPHSPSLFILSNVRKSLSACSKAAHFFYFSSDKSDLLELVEPAFCRRGLASAHISPQSQFAVSQILVAAWRGLAPGDPFVLEASFMQELDVMIHLKANYFYEEIRNSLSEYEKPAESVYLNDFTDCGSSIDIDQKVGDVGEFNTLEGMFEEDVEQSELEVLMRAAIGAATREANSEKTSSTEFTESNGESLDICVSDSERFGDEEIVDEDKSSDESCDTFHTSSQGNLRSEALQQGYKHGDLGSYQAVLSSILPFRGGVNSDDAFSMLGLSLQRDSMSNLSEARESEQCSVNIAHSEVDMKLELLLTSHSQALHLPPHLVSQCISFGQSTNPRTIESKDSEDHLITRGRFLRLGASSISPWGESQTAWQSHVASQAQLGVSKTAMVHGTETSKYSTEACSQPPTQPPKVGGFCSTDANLKDGQRKAWDPAPGDVVFILDESDGDSIAETHNYTPGSLWDKMERGIYNDVNELNCESDSTSAPEHGFQVEKANAVVDQSYIEHWGTYLKPHEVVGEIDVSEKSLDEGDVVIKLDELHISPAAPGSLWSRMMEGTYQNEPLNVDIGTNEEGDFGF